MKLAISGKGGVGKTTLAAALSLLIAEKNRQVLALDADPDANLASALGIPEEVQKNIIPISRQVALIEERTGAKVKQYGQIFKLNPEVADIADNFALNHKGVDLLVLGAVEQGGSGCACPENVLIKSLVTDLIINKDEALIMDMEAGVEHLGRATARGVDHMIVVVEPGQRSIDCAGRVMKMAGEIGLKNILLVGNKIDGDADAEFIKNALGNVNMIGMIPYSDSLRKTDRNGISVLDAVNPGILKIFEQILDQLEK